MDRAALPPLLRGLGTLLLLFASALAFQLERDEAQLRSAAVTRLDASIAREARSDSDDAQLATLVQEVRRLREDEDLVDRVVENTWFQLLGLVGTALLAASFFVEAWQKRRATAKPEDAATEGS